MPELAEVALYARDLNRKTKNHRLTAVKFPNQKNWGDKIIPSNLQKIIKRLVGQVITFESHGKGLQIVDAHGVPQIEFRLGMTGQFYLEKFKEKLIPHCFLEMQFGSTTIWYGDPRRFGRVSLPDVSKHAIGGFRKNRFWHVKYPVPPKGWLNRPRISWLLGNGFDTGVGNYMANEALGALKLSPFENCNSEAEAIRLLKKCLEISKKSFVCGGNSFGTGYYRLCGSEGRFSKYCNFYQNPEVERTIFQGRPVFTKFRIKSNPPIKK